jgi:alpha/beta superfamily hydrolase
MQTPEWLRPGLYGAACGAIALAVVGFSWGGWVTGGKAETMAEARSRADVVAALTAICVDQSKRDPQLAERLAALKTTASWSRGDVIMKNGWATMPGTTEANRLVASACAEKVGV